MVAKAKPKKQKRFKHEIYPWDEWFHLLQEHPKEVRILEKGKDYHCKTHSMVTQLRDAARHYGIRVHINNQETHVEIRKRLAFGN